jgi:UDP-glucose 4-epimerase
MTKKIKKNILLTGGAGYIGSTVAHYLIDKGYNVTIIDNLVTGNKNLVPKKAKLNVCDISNKKKVKKIIQSKKYEYVMHFAGFVRVDESVKFPKKYMKNNFEKTKLFLNTCFNNNLFNIIFSSTASVYRETFNKEKVSENQNLKPKNPYALSKLKAENFIISKSKYLPVKYIILRYFNVAGAENKNRTGLQSKFSTHLIKTACEVAFKERKNLIINGDNYKTKDGTPVRDYIHVSDLAEMHYIAAKNLIVEQKSDIYNCGYGKGYSVKDVVKIFNKVLKKNLPTKVGLRRKSDIGYVVANSNKFKQKFSWRPKYNNLKLIVSSSLKWEKKLKSFDSYKMIK